MPDMRGRGELLLAIVIDSLGTGIFLPFAVLYATSAAHIPVATTGFVLSLGAAFALPITPVAGALVDRFGARRLLIAANLAQALGFAAYPLITGPETLFVCGFLVAAGNQAYFAALGSFIAQLAAPEQRARWFAMLGACGSAGLSGGALLAGLALALLGGSGYPLLAEVNALSFIGAALLIAHVRAFDTRGGSSATAPGSSHTRNDRLPLRVLNAVRTLGGYRPVLHDGPFVGFTATNIAFSLIVLSFSIVLPVYMLGPLRLPIWAPGAAVGMTTAMKVMAQTSVMRWCERYRRTRALAFAACLFAIAMLLLAGLAYAPHDAASASGWTPFGLSLALLVYVTATLIMPLKNAVIADAAPDALRGRYLAFYHLSWSIASTIGPAALTALFALGASWLWLALMGVALVALFALCRLDGALHSANDPARIEPASSAITLD